MAKTEPKTLLFVGETAADAERAAAFFDGTARKLGLAWSAEWRGLAEMLGSGTEPESVNAASIVVIGEPGRAASIQQKFAEIAERVGCWPPAAAASMDAGRLEREVHNLVARILGGSPSPSLAVADESPSLAPTRGQPVTVRVGRETKGRKGKGVTTISDLPLSEPALRELATLLKSRCGTGGTVRDGRIEIQGDQRDRIAAELEKLGYRVKRAGG